jgi:hypothetical protein
VLPQSREAAESGHAGGCAVLRSRPRVRLVSEFEAGADVHHRCASRVDRADDLLDVDSLQVNARGGVVRMPELRWITGSGTPSRASSTA